MLGVNTFETGARWIPQRELVSQNSNGGGMEMTHSGSLKDLMGIYHANLLVHVRQPRSSPYLGELDPYYYPDHFEDFDEIF